MGSVAGGSELRVSGTPAVSQPGPLPRGRTLLWLPRAAARAHMTRFQKLTIATTATTVLLIAAGGLVRATDSGLGCPGWPTCFGRWIPPLEYHAIIEYSHRLLASVAVVLIGIQAVVAWRTYRRVPQIVRPALAAVVLVLVQAALGGIVVEGGLEATLVTLHFATAMTLLAVLVNITANSFCYVKLPTKGSAIGGSDPAFARLTIWTAAAAFVLLIVGAYVRAEEAGLAFPDWPLMDGSLVPALEGVGTLMFCTACSRWSCSRSSSGSRSALARWSTGRRTW